jgi:hypothetical protein
MRLAGLRRWFLISGSAGVLVALVLGGIASYRVLIQSGAQMTEQELRASLGMSNRTTAEIDQVVTEAREAFAA